MNPHLERLQPYPFQKLHALLQGASPNPAFRAINLSIGEPRHATPAFILEAATRALPSVAQYPTTLGQPALRQALADWIARRYALPGIDPQTQVLPVNGSREALFSFAQAVVDPTRPGATVVCPNPFYQIYEGATLLAGATPQFLNLLPENRFALDFEQLPDAVWRRTQLVYMCSPGNPAGNVMSLDEWRRLFELADRYGFVIASDECYSEIYFDALAPPLGALQAAYRLGRHDFRGLVVFSSLSKRSNVPGLRSGFVAGDARILERYLRYRTYHGCAMSPAVQAASLAAWRDESHVEENRRLYRAKFDAVVPLLAEPLGAARPDAGFYLWLRTPFDDVAFARLLYRDYNVTVLPGSYLAREANGLNPGRNFVRVALVAPLEECVEAAERIRRFVAEGRRETAAAR
ncbi:succinyldiaminopimelate transaminase [Pelomicrobium methylotrophicum]|uniref:Succinyldiaminopimelate transaminase n=1 Tax=Pelomicrobium methylotrophicum TaxID=2602750 RepID=A0A5C7EMH2_9PROT|nr:succinyldiaminopimelate transaminase [Pelomicrobium methylotrophicum]TXF13683.1 succinyldiaminopimelate transaminase [Pelomicrobium methylotrophicum]